MRIRAAMEGIRISDEALVKLASMGYQKTLRYAVQLLNPAAQLAQLNYKQEIDMSTLQEVSDLFTDSGESSRILSANQLYYTVDKTA